MSFSAPNLDETFQDTALPTDAKKDTKVPKCTLTGINYRIYTTSSDCAQCNQCNHWDAESLRVLTSQTRQRSALCSSVALRFAQKETQGEKKSVSSTRVLCLQFRPFPSRNPKPSSLPFSRLPVSPTFQQHKGSNFVLFQQPNILIKLTSMKQWKLKMLLAKNALLICMKTSQTIYACGFKYLQHLNKHYHFAFALKLVWLVAKSNVCLGKNRTNQYSSKVCGEQ